LDAKEIEIAQSRFHEEHDRAYGFSAPEELVEFVNFRLTAVGRIDKPRLHEIGRQTKSGQDDNPRLHEIGRQTESGQDDNPRLHEISEDASEDISGPMEMRSVYFAECDGFIDCPLYDRYQLAAGATVAGPAVVTEMDATTLIHPGFQADVDRYGNLLLTAADCRTSSASR
jgi:N-methylhydantoinase A